MPRLLVKPDVVADDLEPCEVDVVQVQQDGVGQVFFTHSLTSESAGLWDARSETILDFRLSCNLARCFIRYLRRCQRSPLLEAAHSSRAPASPHALLGGSSRRSGREPLPIRRFVVIELLEAAGKGGRVLSPESRLDPPQRPDDPAEDLEETGRVVLEVDRLVVDHRHS